MGGSVFSTMALDTSTRLMARDPSSVNVNNVTLQVFVLIGPEEQENRYNQSGAAKKKR